MPAVQPGPAVVSMRDLLASCAAANAVSRPPEPERPRKGAEPAHGCRRAAATARDDAAPDRRHLTALPAERLGDWRITAT
ncbi:hypothetical protein ABZ923_06615 [Streptomyces sp. NPDC046881]|uniref:hypothetical protein n=1 Tax=Streptomyces sp. NPDC046881 TaxID=3155374 RepID=UPI0034046E07